MGSSSYICFGILLIIPGLILTIGLLPSYVLGCIQMAAQGMLLFHVFNPLFLGAVGFLILGIILLVVGIKKISVYEEEEEE